jgi:host factor-I protein
LLAVDRAHTDPELVERSKDDRRSGQAFGASLGDASLMPQTPEPKTAPALSNIQDAFLNHARREGWPVRIQMMDGREFEGRIRQFDRFAVIVDLDGTDQMVFKHAIAAITMPGGSVPSYGASE